MAKLMRNMLTLAMVQTAVGTPAAPVPGTNAMLVRTAMPSLIKGDFVERPLLRGAKGNYGALFAGPHRTIEFEVELAGSGAAGTGVKYSPLLQGASMSETLQASTSAVYAPVSTGDPVLTIFCYLDGVLFKLTDAKGTYSASLNSKGIPVMKFQYTGAYSAPTDTALPTGASFTGFTQPLTVGKVNTPTFTVGGVSACTESFEFDMGNQVEWRELINCAGARNPDRKPTAKAVIELNSVAERNWAESCRLGDKFAIALVHGVTAGNIVQFDAPAAQINAEPTISDSGGIAMLNLSMAITPVAGNDEFTWTFK